MNNWQQAKRGTESSWGREEEKGKEALKEMKQATTSAPWSFLPVQEINEQGSKAGEHDV